MDWNYINPGFVLPLLPIAFIVSLVFFRSYKKIRSFFKIKVNCWFCNGNTYVSYELNNRWVCPHCGQYNGFSKDGDYNCEILAQRECNAGFKPLAARVYQHPENDISNGLCAICNEKQSQKIDKLAQFEPENEDNFDEELAEYRKMLEDLYKLCRICEANTAKILAQKKKVILGAKLAQIWTKPAQTFKSLNIFQSFKISRKRQFYRRTMAIVLFSLAMVNFNTTVNRINLAAYNIKKESFLHEGFFILMTHIVTLTRLLTNTIYSLFNIKIIEKSLLYIRTIFILACIALKINIFKQSSIIALLRVSGLKYGSLLLTFAVSCLDNFRVSRYLLLLTAWSINIATNSIEETEILLALDIVKVVSAFAAILLSIPNGDESDRAGNCLDSTANSFHRIYSEDYLDKTADTANSSGLHNLSTNSCRSLIFNKSSSPVSCRSNLTSSVYSLNKSPGSEFKKYNFEERSRLNDINNISKNLNTSRMLFGANLESNRAPSVLSMNNSFYTARNLSNVGNDLADFSTITSPARKNPTLRSNFYSNPLSPSLSYCSGVSQRPNLLSPSRFSNNCQVYSNNSWIPCNDNLIKSAPKLFKDNSLLNLTTAENISRASSHSSGFESQASSYFPACENSFSRESSAGRELDLWSLPNCDNQSVMDLRCSGRGNSFINSTNTLQQPMSPPLLHIPSTDQATNWCRSDNLDLTAINLHNKSLNRFKFGEMHSFLPSIQKGSLFQQK